MIGPPEQKEFSDEDIETLLKKSLETLSVKDAAADVARQTGRPKKDVYAKALEIQQ